MLTRIIKLALSVFVAVTDWMGKQIRKMMGRSPRSTCVVLAYHSVTPNQRAQFTRQMNELVRHTKPIPADLASLPKQGGHHAAVTFDDGLENIIENALPELRKRNIPSTLFIVTEVLGGHPGWDPMGGDDPSQERAMSEGQLQELPSDLVTIGSHTMTHKLLPSVDKEQLRQELLGSRMKLEKLLNREVKLFSFPYGAFNENVIEACRDASYTRVFTALPVLAFSQPQEFVTGRVGVAPTDWPIEFRLKLAGAYRWLPYAFALKRRILSGLRGHGGQNPGFAHSGESAR